MDVFIAILFFIAAGLLATTRPAYRIRRAQPVAAFVAGGWLSVTCGVLLGPNVTGVINREAVYQTVPLVAICLGWIGLLVGLQLRLSLLRSLPRVVYSLAAADFLVSAVVFSLIGAAALVVWVPEPQFAMLALPVVFIAASSMGWSLETRSLGIPFDRRLELLVRSAGALAGVGAVLLFGVTSKAINTDPTGALAFLPVRAGIKLVHGAALALAIGIIGRYMLRLASSSRGNQFAVILGIVAFVSGAAKQLDVSPLITAMIAGAVITNMEGREFRQFEKFIFKAEHTFAILFGLLAGLLLEPSLSPELLVAALGIIVARLAIKPVLLRLFSREFVEPEAPDQEPTPSTVAHYMTAARQSPLMLALAVSLVLLEPSVFHKELLWLMVIVGAVVEFPARLGRSPSGDSAPRDASVAGVAS